MIFVIKYLKIKNRYIIHELKEYQKILTSKSKKLEIKKNYEELFDLVINFI